MADEEVDDCDVLEFEDEEVEGTVEAGFVDVGFVVEWVEEEVVVGFAEAEVVLDVILVVTSFLTVLVVVLQVGLIVFLVHEEDPVIVYVDT